MGTTGAEDRSGLICKTGLLALGAILYRQMDWVLVALSASLVALFKYHRLSHLSIYGIFWMVNLLLSWAVIVCSEKIQVDFTLSNGWRRLVDKAGSRSRLLGGILEVAFVTGIGLWAGAGPLYIFLKEKIRHRAILIGLLVLVSGIQMAVWTLLFVLGYDSATSIFSPSLSAQ